MLQTCNRALLDLFSHFVFCKALAASSASCACFFICLVFVACKSSLGLILHSELCHTYANNTRVMLHAKLHYI